MHLFVARILFSFAVLVLALLPAAAQDLKERKIGVVLMHGKWGAPNTRFFYKLEHALESAGVVVEKPEMPWSGRRDYDAGYEGAMKDIDNAVAKLKAKGASRIVVGGHSFGGNGGGGYGATRDGLTGIFAIAPGHVPDGNVMRASFANDVAHAKQLAAAGKDDDIAFKDPNVGKIEGKRAKASVFLSYFDPEGPAAMFKNAAMTRPNTPVLWVVAKTDPLFNVGKAIYGKVPAHPKNRYAEVEGGHMEAPGNSVEIVLDWLKAITD